MGDSGYGVSNAAGLGRSIWSVGMCTAGLGALEALGVGSLATDPPGTGSVSTTVGALDSAGDSAVGGSAVGGSEWSGSGAAQRGCSGWSAQ